MGQETCLDMRYYINRQPEALRETLDASADMLDAFVKIWKDRRPGRLYLVGSGTSGNAARAAAPLMEKILGTEVTALSPTAAPDTLRNNPCALFISQGGQSTNILAAIERLRDVPSAALTGETECRANSLLPHVVLSCGHEEAGPKTMGYTCTILTLYRMALEVSGLPEEEKRRYLDALRRMTDSMPENIAATWEWVSAQEEQLVRAENWAAAATDTGRFVAQEAALKLQETILRPAQGFEFEEYLHGPTMMLQEKMGGMYLLPPQGGPDKSRMEALAEYHRSYGSPVVTAGTGSAAKCEGGNILYNVGEEEWLTPFWQILPSQCMGARLPSLMDVQGRGHRIFKDIDRAVGVKYGGKA